MRHPAARSTRVGLLLATVALLTVACGDTEPRTAAYVGAATVSVDELQAQVSQLLVYRDGPGAPAGAPTADRLDVRSHLPLVTQRVLSQDVVARLVDAAVQRTRFQVDQESVRTQLAALDVSALLAQPGQSYLTPDTLAALVRDQLVLAQLGKQAWNGLSVRADFVQATGREDAQAKAQQMAMGDTASGAVVAAAVAAGQQAKQGLTLTPAAQATLTTTPVFSTPAGGSVAFELAADPSQASVWYAARISTRTTDGTAPSGSGAVTANQASIEQTLSLGLSLLPQLAGTPTITINPRYGQWDPTAGRVIAASDVAAAVVIPPVG